MRVILASRAEKQLKKLSKINQIAIAKKIRSIRDDEGAHVLAEASLSEEAST